MKQFNTIIWPRQRHEFTFDNTEMHQNKSLPTLSTNENTNRRRRSRILSQSSLSPSRRPALVFLQHRSCSLANQSECASRIISAHDCEFILLISMLVNVLLTFSMRAIDNAPTLVMYVPGSAENRTNKASDEAAGE